MHIAISMSKMSIKVASNKNDIKMVANESGVSDEKKAVAWKLI